MGGRRRGSSKRHKPQYTCIFCERQFPCHRNFEEHMHIHTRERPRSCSKCDIWFKSTATLCAHNRVVHMGIKLICDICSREFNDRSNLYAHRKRIHGCNGKSKVDRSFANCHAGSKSGGAGRKKARKKVPTSKKEKATIAMPGAQKLELSLRTIKKKQGSFGTGMKNVTSTWRQRSEFKCPVCGQLIAGENFNLKRHMKRKHGEEGPQQEATLTCFPHQIKDYAIPFAPFDRHIDWTNSPPMELPFKLHSFLPIVSTDNTWDSSFFLHLNRYRQEDSCFSETSNFIQKEIPCAAVKMNFKKERAKKKTAVVLNKNLIVNRFKKINQSLKVGFVKEEERSEITKIEQDIKVELSLQIVGVKNEGKGGQKETSCLETSKCTNWEKTFAYRAQLHQTTAKSQNNSRLNSCVFCKQEFGDMRCNLARHIAGVHRYKEKQTGFYKLGARRKFSDYSCAFCGLTAHGKEILSRHISANHLQYQVEVDPCNEV